MLGTWGLWRLALRFREMWLVAGATLISAAALSWLRPSVAVALVAAACGIAGWAASEYVFHRFVLHLPRPRWRIVRALHARLHWRHHQEPDDPRLLFIPAWGTVGLFAMAAGIGYAAGGWTCAAGSAFGLGLALLHYESTHLAAHVAYAPRTRWGAFMKRFHRLHHYKNERYWFGVTHPFADMIVGTWPDARTVAKSSTARTLGIEPEPVGSLSTHPTGRMGGD
jgi:sterol desaturase/sphingolipid hydroxylase (fatty acid hydroxylase superfamily)